MLRQERKNALEKLSILRDNLNREVSVVDQTKRALALTRSDADSSSSSAVFAEAAQLLLKHEIRHRAMSLEVSRLQSALLQRTQLPGYHGGRCMIVRKVVLFPSQAVQDSQYEYHVCVSVCHRDQANISPATAMPPTCRTTIECADELCLLDLADQWEALLEVYVYRSRRESCLQPKSSPTRVLLRKLGKQLSLGAISGNDSQHAGCSQFMLCASAIISEEIILRKRIELNMETENAPVEHFIDIDAVLR